MDNTGNEYFEAFNAKIKTKTFEQFTLLLCDLSKAKPEQKRLLGAILFDNHQAPENWLQYLEYITTWFADRKLQIQRLYCKAIELIPENELTKNNPKYLQIHLHVANTKSTIEDKCKYYEQILQRKNIGTKLSNLYLTWSACLVSKDCIAEAVAVIEKGLQNGAEPRLLLSNQLKELFHVIKERTAKKRSVTCFDNGEVQFKRRIRRASESSNEEKNDEMEDDATEKIEPSLMTENTTAAVVEKKKASTSKLTPRGLSGKCQRVVHAAAAVEDSEPPAVPAATRTSTRSSSGGNGSTAVKSSFAIFEDPPNTLPTAAIEETKAAKEEESATAKKASSSLKSKYIDDTLRNFNPIKKASTIAVIPVTTTTANSTCKTVEKEEKASSGGVKIPSFLDNMGITPAMILPSTTTAVAAMEGVTSTSLSSSMTSNSTSTIKEQDEETEKMPTHDLQQLLVIQAPVIAQKLSASSEAVPPVPIASVLSVEQSPMTGNGKRKRVSFSADPVLSSEQYSEQHARIKRTTSTQSSAIPAPPLPSNGMIFSDISRQIMINNTQYIQLSLLGKGGSSSVHRVISSTDGSIYALKRVDVKDQEDSDSVLDSYCNEIRLLQALKGTSSYIIDLIDHEVKKEEHTVMMILEAGDIDLAKLLNQRMKNAKQLPSSSSSSSGASNPSASSSIGGALDPIFTRLVWKEMLLAVNHIHSHRIVHGDLKPANFVFVKGHLKLIDFGIAKSFSTDTTNIYRESQIGTVNYMAPEAICPDSITRSDDPEEDDEAEAENNQKGKNKGEKKAHYTMKLGRASDIWSLGCILYQMLYGRPPFANLNTIQKLSAIPNPNYTIPYPEHEESDGIESVKACLVRQPKERMPITELLEMSYLTIGNRNTSPKKSSNNSFDQENVKNVLSILKKEAVRMLGGNTSNNTQSKKVQAWFDSLNSEDIYQQTINHQESSEDMKEDDEVTEEEINDDDTTIKLPSSDDEKERSPPPPSSEPSSALKQSRKPLSSLSASIINARNNTPNSASKKSNFGLKKSTFVKSPVKVLPLSLQAQIATQALNLRSAKGQEGNSNAEKWMKKKEDDPENQPMHVMLANRIGAIRKFMDLDQDNITATESMDISGIHDFF